MKDSLFEQPKDTSPSKAKIYTVSQITSLIKVSLEETLPGRLTITGEISGFKRHSSGHCYFDLKDEDAVLPAVIWKSDFAKLKFKPENGLAVLAKGHIDVYPPQGKYQFYADTLAPAGMGALQLAFEQMKNKLAAEGLFDEAHKKPLPKFPFKIGVLTSKSGAALHDIVDSIYNRWPAAKLLFYDVPVQGEGAAEKIASAIKNINNRNAVLRLDVIIVGRGGGSMEDLWAFNEEAVARAIYNSKIPVISAVGHEVDFTISDLVADARASTPTKAGVIAVPDIKEVLNRIDSAGKRIKADAESAIKLSAQKLKTILAAVLFRNPLLIVQNREQLLDEIENNLPQKADRLLSAVKLQIETLAAKLTACNPKSVLNRGYSITKIAVTGKIAKSVAEININDIIITEFKDEKMIESRVTKK
ncbi:MAG: exodeoxyribonuclease VII large subunit [Planctomycetes bacterium HGW-Planctomycetes-1]|nr:MAG: exodeoxyribonuclease VII large subunit [Planctomycetes bacterium HGW-Planctomycetes-1]